MNSKGRESSLNFKKPISFRIGKFSVDFHAKLLTSSLAGVSGSLAFFFPIFLAVARQFSKQVSSFPLWKKTLQNFATKTPPFSNQTGVAIVIRYLRTQSPAQNHGKEARSQAFRDQNTD